MTMLSRNQFRSNFWSRIQAPQFSYGAAATIAVLSSDFYLHQWLIPSILTAFAFPLAFPITTIDLYKSAEKKWNRFGLRRWMAFGSFIGLLSVCTLTVLLTTVHPEVANAQFFKNAETWMKDKFTGADKAIEIVFNVLRGLFLIYLGISLVKVIQAARQDQDWQDLARTPLIIVIAVSLGDILATFITGT